MQTDEQTLSPGLDSKGERLVGLGAWLGRHQAFGLIANRCTAADAECLKAIRDNRDYKELGLTWEEFCRQRAGISRVYAERLIGHLEEFGANYFRLAELMQISRDTYRLIAGSVSDEGIVIDGERVPIQLENRNKIVAAVQSVREKAGSERDGAPKVAAARKRLDAFLGEVRAIAETPDERLELMALVDKGIERLNRFAEGLRQSTLIAE